MKNIAKKPVLIMFGGESAEHEVSIISGLQVVEKIDRTKYEPHVVYVGKNGEMQYLGSIQNRKDFLTAKRMSCSFGKDTNTTAHDGRGGYVRVQQMLGSTTIRPYAAFLAFHGGTGESGQWQGMLEACGIPHTGSGTEGASVAMNKRLTNEVLASAGVQSMKGAAVRSTDVARDSLAETKRVIGEVGLPCIVKPVHLGSSIAITIAKDVASLEKALIEASRVDSEVLVEELCTDFVEYNVSLRVRNGTLECSAVERPHSKDEILSFADKYQRGGKKTGAGSAGGSGGMASLDREVPARISPELKERIEATAKKAYTACRIDGVPRIDFMYKTATDELFLTEINPIPGSLAFYLWEASGVPFVTQISDALEQAVLVAKEKESKRLDYKTDIVEKFCV